MSDVIFTINTIGNNNSISKAPKKVRVPKRTINLKDCINHYNNIKRRQAELDYKSYKRHKKNSSSDDDEHDGDSEKAVALLDPDDYNEYDCGTIYTYK